MFMWRTAYAGIPGNEKTDRVAKEAVKREQVDIITKLSKSEGNVTSGGK